MEKKPIGNFDHVENATYASNPLSKTEIQVKNLTDRALRALRCSATGMSIGDIARTTGYSYDYVSKLRQSVVGKSYLVEIRREIDKEWIDHVVQEDHVIGTNQRVRKILDEESVATLSRLLELRDSEDENVSLRASKDILDRAGFKSTETVELSGSVEASPQLLSALTLAKSLQKE